MLAEGQQQMLFNLQTPIDQVDIPWDRFNGSDEGVVSSTHSSPQGLGVEGSLNFGTPEYGGAADDAEIPDARGYQVHLMDYGYAPPQVAAMGVPDQTNSHHEVERKSGDDLGQQQAAIVSNTRGLQEYIGAIRPPADTPEIEEEVRKFLAGKSQKKQRAEALLIQIIEMSYTLDVNPNGPPKSNKRQGDSGEFEYHGGRRAAKRFRQGLDRLERPSYMSDSEDDGIVKPLIIGKILKRI